MASTISLRLPEEMLDALKAKAKSTPNETVSGMVEDMITEFIENTDPKSIRKKGPQRYTSIVISPDLEAELQLLSEETGISVASLVRLAVENSKQQLPTPKDIDKYSL